MPPKLILISYTVLKKDGWGTAPVRYLIYQKIVDAVPLQRIYLSQTLFELVLEKTLVFYVKIC
ncbi:hypothetical protein FDUTEX481_04911 [Tolypothrix sp. PCC 7601]|nr:hypothetical protein FDUTEX481_04911 [Tolypothrix sp. PCC 7601]BAY89742.1 hypothetical protein NIES3275_17450 [Microchaete diplosiphon NIES-3275]